MVESVDDEKNEMSFSNVKQKEEVHEGNTRQRSSEAAGVALKLNVLREGTEEKTGDSSIIKDSDKSCDTCVEVEESFNMSLFSLNFNFIDNNTTRFFKIEIL